MTTNIVITSDDVVKAQALGDTIAQALEERGFNNLTCTFAPPFRKPMGNDIHKSLTALEEIQGQYPDFLAEQINIRAIPVMDVDPNYDDTTCDTNPEKQIAFAVADRSSKKRGVFDTVVVFESEGQGPKQVILPKMDAVIMRAIKEAGNDLSGRIDLQDTALKMDREGSIKNGFEIYEALCDVERQKVLSNAVEAIRDETGYGTPEISEETKALVRRDREARDRREKMHVVEKEEQP